MEEAFSTKAKVSLKQEDLQNLVEQDSSLQALLHNIHKTTSGASRSVKINGRKLPPRTF